LGQTLWPGDKWRCFACLEDTLPGEDSTSKSMIKMMEYQNESHAAFALEANGSNAERHRNEAERAMYIAAEIRKQGNERSKQICTAKGEAVKQKSDKTIYDTMTIPDGPAVEASFERTRLLLKGRVAAMGLDAADSIQAGNSLEKMLAHQLAATHRAVMEHIGSAAPTEYNVEAQSKRLNAAARCMTAYQHGLLTLHKIRQNGNQRILVQYVSVNEGGQAVVGNIERR
jgi:hypothetical protein